MTSLSEVANHHCAPILSHITDLLPFIFLWCFQFKRELIFICLAPFKRNNVTLIVSTTLNKLR